METELLLEWLYKTRNHWQWLWITGDVKKYTYKPATVWINSCACCESVKQQNIEPGFYYID